MPNNEIETTTIGDGANALTVPRLLTGLWQLAGVEADDGKLKELASGLQPYVNSGLAAFDMADRPGRMQGGHRPGVQAYEHQVHRPHAVPYLALRRHRLHNLYELTKMQKEGRIKNLGLTNVNLAHLRLLHSTGFKLVTNQLSMSVLDRRAELGGMAEWCAKNGVKLLAYGTLLGGFLSEGWVGKPEPSAKELGTMSLQKYKRFIDVAVGGWDAFQKVLAACAEVAKKHNVAIPAVATRYVLQQQAVGCVIVGSRLDNSVAQKYIDRNKAVFSFELDDADMRTIREAQKALKPIPNDCGDEYRVPPFLTASGDLGDHLDPAAEREQLATVERIANAGGRVQVSGGSKYEPIAGYCRAVRVGKKISVSGTTTLSHPSGTGVIGGKSTGDQATFILDIISGAVRALGGSMADVVRTRVMLTDVKNWEPVCKVHAAAFKPFDVRPSNTMVGGIDLIGDGLLVEIEADAELGGQKTDVLNI
ncbi:hypothetical protein A1Q2_04202 [Trichosporon asahii var. asahii CBS 8904]|uniref:NADP-dependent oxidoreductase domain-containing protein n=1 Tax=Trichosporon asahii var. asahii (strain CBS 8904) TaxID=1220162 RepID=K1VBW9_TRIAC|nr:hypothetical protein A1Q2_04202 [Trichosporon asahii var. asahii CBS 8904]